MRPLKTYEPWGASMYADPRGGWCMKVEAEARILELEAEVETAREEADRRTREVEATYSVQKRLEAERDAARADAERYRDRVDELRSGLAATLGWMEHLRLSGDAGFWDWSEGDEYSKGFAALWAALAPIDAARGKE